MSFAEIVWALVLAAALGFEGYTIWIDRKPGTTLSAVVIKLRAIGLVRGILVSSISWLIYHWFFETDYLAQAWTDDISLTVTAFLATLVKRSPRSGMR